MIVPLYKYHLHTFRSSSMVFAIVLICSLENSRLYAADEMPIRSISAITSPESRILHVALFQFSKDDSLLSMIFSCDGKSYNVHQYNMASGKLVFNTNYKVLRHDSNLMTKYASITSNHRTIITPLHRDICKIDSSKKSIIGTSFDNALQGLRIIDSQEDQYIALTGSPNRLLVHRVHFDSPRKHALLLNVAYNTITCCECSNDGKLISIACSDGDAIRNVQNVEIWDLVVAKKISRLPGCEAGITCMAFSPNKQFLAIGSKDCTLRVYRISDGKVVLHSIGSQKSISDVAFDPSSDLVMYSSYDNLGSPNVRIIDLKTKMVRHILSADNNGMHAIAWSADNSLFATIGDSGVIRVWRYRSEKEP